MCTVQIQPSSGLLFPTRHREGSPETDCGSQDTPQARSKQQQVETMGLAFRAHGGFVGADDVVYRLCRIPDQSPSTLQHWLSSRKVLNVSWRDQTLMPMFQFDLEIMAIKPGCARVVDELRAVLDDWELTLWFATPNAWLGCTTPVALLASDDIAVLQAARADRFIFRG